MNVMEVIHQRRAVRAYEPTPVDDESVQALLDAAVQAPTALHLEPWAFVVVQDRQLLHRLSDRAKLRLRQLPHRESSHSAVFDDMLANPDFNIFYDAGTLIVICARPLSDYVDADCWLAAENLMLAACDRGLATCPIGFALAVLDLPEVKEELGIPVTARAVAPIIVGVPRVASQPPTGRRSPEILSWKR